MSDFAELESFDSSFKPQESGMRLGLEILPDGDYDFQITSMVLERTKKENTLILRQGLRVLSGSHGVGKELERAYFFKSQQNVDILGGDLCRLNFDADKWTTANNRPFSKELQAVLPKCVGLRFRGKKSSNADNGKTYHNLYINSLITGGSVPVTAGNPPLDESTIPF